MNIAIWQKALKVIPNVWREEWASLDLISTTRAAVLIMTFISALLAGLFAWRDNSFSFPALAEESSYRASLRHPPVRRKS